MDAEEVGVTEGAGEADEGALVVDEMVVEIEAHQMEDNHNRDTVSRFSITTTTFCSLWSVPMDTYPEKIIVHYNHWKCVCCQTGNTLTRFTKFRKLLS